MMFNKLVKKNIVYLMLGVLSLSFFIGTSSYNYLSQSDDFIKWGSPDETANYAFAKLYGQTGEMRIFEKYNLYANDIIHPRSMRSDSGQIKLVSFLGIVLIYGKIVALTSYKILPYLTPFFAALGIIFYYLLIKKVFNARLALISAFLLASFPPFIYYSARSLFHNVLFTVLLIIGLYYAVLMAAEGGGKKSNLGVLYSALSGLFFGLAIITRTAEILWILPLLFILWIFNIRKISFVKLLIFLSFLFFALLPVFYWNQILYSSPFKGGYQEMNESISRLASTGYGLAKTGIAGGGRLLLELKNNIFHFGFSPGDSLIKFYQYFTRMFYWIFWPAVLGFLIFIHKWRSLKRKHWAYLSSYFVASLVLLFYYGSWQFHDNPDPNQITIGNSYTRYWLPLYLGALPFASIFILKLTKLIKGWVNIAVARALIITFIFFISIQFVLYGSEEGLAYSYQNSNLARKEFARVMELTEHNSVIITQYHDKLFFPRRKVIVGLFDNKDMVARYGNLSNYLPLYYYNFTLSQEDIDYLNDRRLGEAGLRIEPVERVTEDFVLYKLTPTNLAL